MIRYLIFFCFFWIGCEVYLSVDRENFERLTEEFLKDELSLEWQPISDCPFPNPFASPMEVTHSGSGQQEIVCRFEHKNSLQEAYCLKTLNPSDFNAPFWTFYKNHNKSFIFCHGWP